MATITSFVVGGSFDPSSIAGLSLWLDASGSTNFVFSSGTIISQWKDKSTNANNANTSQTVFTYNSTGFNSLPTVTFPGTQTTGFSLLASLLPNGTSDASYFFVLRKTNASTDLFLSYGGSSQTKQFYASNSLKIDRAGTSLISDSTNIQGTNIIISSTETSLTAGVNGWLNGTAFTTNGATTVWNVPTTFAWLGSGSSSGTTNKLTGFISEVIVYNSALSTDNRQKIEGYLAWKWNLQSSLPVGHPYKSSSFGGINYGSVMSEVAPGTNFNGLPIDFPITIKNTPF